MGERGFDAVTLEQVGQMLGITRGAVLYHFPTKAAVLNALVMPFLEQIDALLDEAEAADVLAPRARRRLLTSFVDALVLHRDAASMMARDVSGQKQLAPEQQLVPRTARLAALLRGPDPTPADRIRAFCAIGAAVRPITVRRDQLDLDDPAARKIIVASALAALRG